MPRLHTARIATAAGTRANARWGPRTGSTVSYLARAVVPTLSASHFSAKDALGTRDVVRSGRHERGGAVAPPGLVRATHPEGAFDDDRASALGRLAGLILTAGLAWAIALALLVWVIVLVAGR